MKRGRGSHRKPKNIRQPGHDQNELSEENGNPATHEQPKGISLKPSINAPSAEEHEHHTHERRFWDRQIRIAKWLNGITLVSAIVALLGLIALYLSIIGADDSTLRANRAWIAPGPMVLNWPLEQLGPVRIALHIENTGREPAIDIAYAFNEFLVPYIPEGPGNRIITQVNKTCDGLHPTAAEGMVLYPAKSNVAILSGFEDTPANREIAAKARNREDSLIVEGCIAYRTFGATHMSKFRYFLRDVAGPSCAPRPGGGIQCSWAFNSISVGNEAN
jgi:hypothetical protein